MVESSSLYSVFTFKDPKQPDSTTKLSNSYHSIDY